MVILTWRFDSIAKIQLTVSICLCWFNLTCQFQVFPQTFEGQYPYYQGPPGPPGPQGPTEPYLTQAPYQGSYYSGPHSATVPWEGLKTYGDTTKQPGRYLSIHTIVVDVVLSDLSDSGCLMTFFICFGSAYSVYDGAKPRQRQQWWWPHTVLPVSVFCNIMLLLPLESAGTMFLSVLIGVGNGNRNIKHLLISAAKTSQLEWSSGTHIWENTTICWFKRNVFSKARFISCVYMYD